MKEEISNLYCGDSCSGFFLSPFFVNSVLTRFFFFLLMMFFGEGFVFLSVQEIS